MSISSYEIVKQVVEQRSFLKAAETIGLTPSAVSRSISTLEEQWGFSLFIRGKNGVRLTEEGERIYPYLCSVLHSQETLEQQLSRIKGLESGSVRIAALGSVCISWMPEILRSFTEKYPNISVTLAEGETNDCIRMLRDGLADIGFVTLPVEDGMREIPLYEDPLYCVTAEDYYPESKHYVDREDLRSLSFISPQSGYDLGIMNFWEKHGVKPRYSRVVGDNAILAMVEGGLGACIVPGLFLDHSNRHITAYPIMPREYRTLGLILRQKEHTSPATDHMVRHIVHVMKQKKLINVDLWPQTEQHISPSRPKQEE